MPLQAFDEALAGQPTMRAGNTAAGKGGQRVWFSLLAVLPEAACRRLPAPAPHMPSQLRLPAGTCAFPAAWGPSINVCESLTSKHHRAKALVQAADAVVRHHGAGGEVCALQGGSRREGSGAKGAAMIPCILPLHMLGGKLLNCSAEFNA